MGLIPGSAFYNSDLVPQNTMHEADVATFTTFGGRVQEATDPQIGPLGWSAADITPGYLSALVAVNAATGNTLSAAINPHANGIEVTAQFSDGATSCDIAVLNDNGTGTFVTVATFTGKNNLNAGGMTVGPWPTGVALGGRNIKIQILNYAGTGTVSVKVLRLN